MRGDFNELMEEIESNRHIERILDFWKRYSTWILGIVIGLLFFVAVHSIYNNHQQHLKMYYSDLFEEGRLLIKQSKEKEGIEKLENVSKCKFSNYATISKFELAQYYLKKNKIDEARNLLKQISQGKGINPFFSTVAKMNLINLSTEKLDEKANKIETFKDSVPELTPLCLELKAYLLFKNGDLNKARDTFMQIIQSENSDINSKERAQLMIRLISIKIRGGK